MLKQIIFDLDGTLYPQSSLEFQSQARRRLQYLMAFKGLTFANAKDLYKETKEKSQYIIDVADNKKEYLDYIYPAQECLMYEKDFNLAFFLKDTLRNYKIIVVSNSPRAHIQRVLDVLKISDIITEFYGYEDFDYKPKFTYFNSMSKDELETSILVDDDEDNCKYFTKLGGRACVAGKDNYCYELINWLNLHKDNL